MELLEILTFIFLFIIILEILPLIEFHLEDGISDSEAMKLIQNSYDINKPQESLNDSQNTNMYILDKENQNEPVDPFTYKLMNYEVNR